jgi:hypothetical protein
MSLYVNFLPRKRSAKESNKVPKKIASFSFLSFCWIVFCQPPLVKLVAAIRRFFLVKMMDLSPLMEAASLAAVINSVRKMTLK